jgi:hypothetical protein
MNFQGITIGIITFAIIGIFHPIVIKTEYYLGKKVWPVFLVKSTVNLLIQTFRSSQEYPSLSVRSVNISVFPLYLLTFARAFYLV